MPKSTVYIETSVVSYRSARPASDPIVAAHQKMTQDWWDNRRADFELRVSEFVIGEAQDGDPKAAEKRLQALSRIPSLALVPEVESVAKALLDTGAVPPKARLDAFHIAVACVQGIDFLLTWNFKHIANAERWVMIESVCERMGLRMSHICSPLELLEHE
uniref:PIN domain-containing protein n=1 Tax=Candidatus Kentrum sp. UNK TaxID=2126344 RepID=A0A451B261_9GAMM|nr:MAG: hypothetical protein BECKUNK1418G_GA0071005_11161 [Candidatus Kentron sp. UNK]VFK72362.1 MAG: hypothetical protein BECKUNK1418H_GA0071006_111011 [Candidatus Kentron sp. UNK]